MKVQGEMDFVTRSIRFLRLYLRRNSDSSPGLSSFTIDRTHAGVFSAAP